jgi:hypothetical protein
MSITNPRVIDFWAIPKRELHDLVLVITDRLEWGGKAEQVEHLLLLQEKINTYIAAQPPSVKGLRPIELTDDEQGVIKFSDHGHYLSADLWLRFRE